jgi:hypothetical protein
MISGSAALSASNTTTGSLSYISELVSGATQQGLYRIIVNNSHINDTMATELRNVYGYNVTKRNSFMGTYDDYLISWGDIIPEPQVAPVGGSGTISFNGTSAYVRVPHATMTTWLPGTDDFTVEFFLKRTGNGTGFPRVFSIGPDTEATLGCSIESGTAYIWADNGTGAGQWMNGAMPASYNNGSAWCHIAVSRISGVTRLYVGGQYKSKSSSVRSINGTIHAGEPMYMGGDGATNWFQGKLTNFRWVNTGLYAGSETTITVPTEPLSNIAQTKLLLLGGSVENPVLDATGINTLVDSNTDWGSDTPFA